MNKNPQKNNDHEIHKSSCNHLPKEENQYELGLFADCHKALEKAKIIDKNADGCLFCSPNCHSS